jgi:hypothetical protein
VPEEENGEVEPVDRLGIVVCRRLVSALLPFASELVLSVRGSALLPRLRVDSELGLAIDRARLGLRLLSRASRGVTSAGDRLETERKTRPISAEGSATDGDLVVRGPLMVVAVRLPSVGITRSPDCATRDRLGLAKSVSGTTVHPLRSTSANRTWPLISTACCAPDGLCAKGSAKAPPEVRGGTTSRR